MKPTICVTLDESTVDALDKYVAQIISTMPQDAQDSTRLRSSTVNTILRDFLCTKGLFAQQMPPVPVQ